MLETEISPILEEHHDDENHIEEVDYSAFSKEDFIKYFEKAFKSSDLAAEYNSFKKAKGFIDHIYEEEKNAALEKFTADGSSPDDFEFHSEPFFEKFESFYSKSRNLFVQKQKELTHQKDQNYKVKVALLEQMRTLAEGSTGKSAFDKFKNLQQEWKNTGAVPQERASELWSNYHAVCNRFYDNRSIAFELLDLDRKRNLNAKILICEKAEALTREVSIKKCLAALEELHEEFKHIGPVPKENQEEIWQRLKASSDAVHERKKIYLEEQKSKNEANTIVKVQLLEKLKTFTEFQSESASEWAAKTKEVETFQLEWKNAGLVGKEKAKEINRQYWDGLKAFFNAKRAFFKSLESEKNENLKKKTALCEKAESLINSENTDNTQVVIELQKEWKTIGFVPLKVKDKIYERFKKACDAVFEAKRNIAKQAQEEAKLQLKAKLDFLDKFEKLSGLKTLKEIEENIAEWDSFPESDGLEYFKAYNRFAEIVRIKLKEVTDLEEVKKDELVSKLVSKALKFHPDSEKEIQARERKLRKDIRDIEDNMAQYKNNMEFFARAKNADAIRKEFTDKIDDEQKKLEILKSRLKILLQK